MQKCEGKEITISGCKFNIPFYYQGIDALPSDPVGAVPFAVVTPYAQCFFIGYEIEAEQMIPMKQDILLEGVRGFLADNQGIIECETDGVFAYCIVKTLNEPSGVQYTLTFQEIVDNKIIFIQGSFEEDGTTGLRDNIVYNILRNDNQVGSDDDPFLGWAKDPYDESITSGALMNLSEQRRFDEQFDGSPLQVCRELVDFLVENSVKRD